MNTIETILKRCSYRGKYSSVPVPREDLITIMEAGLAAPSGCNKQTTSLIAVDDPVVLQRLHSVIRPDVAPTAPAAICVVTQYINAYRDRCFAVQDYSAAIENILLAASSLGYQSCWYEGHITDEDRINEKMAEILGVPEGYEIVCFLPIGIGEEEPVRAKKKPFEERAFFNSFGEAEQQTLSPKSITEILLDSLASCFGMHDRHLTEISKELGYGVEITRHLHLDTDLTVALLYAWQLVRRDIPACAEPEDISRSIRNAKAVLAEILKETEHARIAGIGECLDRLAERTGVSPEERLVYMFIDAEADMSALRDVKDRLMTEGIPE